MTKLLIVLTVAFFSTFSALAEDKCEPQLEAIALEQIQQTDFHMDETFNFRVLRLNSDDIVEHYLKTYVVQGSDQNGPSFWLMVINPKSCKVEYFGLTYSE